MSTGNFENVVLVCGLGVFYYCAGTGMWKCSSIIKLCAIIPVQEMMLHKELN